MAYKHDSAAYLVSIKAANIHEQAMSLYHAASRGEPTGFEEEQVRQSMQDLGNAFDAWVLAKKGG